MVCIYVLTVYFFNLQAISKKFLRYFFKNVFNPKNLTNFPSVHHVFMWEKKRNKISYIFVHNNLNKNKPKIVYNFLKLKFCLITLILINLKLKYFFLKKFQTKTQIKFKKFPNSCINNHRRPTFSTSSRRSPIVVLVQILLFSCFYLHLFIFSI